MAPAMAARTVRRIVALRRALGMLGLGGGGLGEERVLLLYGFEEVGSGVGNKVNVSSGLSIK